MRTLSAAALLLSVAVSGCLGDPDGPDPRAPGTFAWSEATAAPTARTEVAVGNAEGRLYVLGGFPATGTATTLVEVYDVAADAWSTGPAYPVPIHHTAIVEHEGSLYVMGGLVGDAFVPTLVAFRLAPGSNVWEPLAPLPLPRGAHAAALVDESIYLVGGYTLGFQHVAPTHVYDIGSNTWSTAADVPTLRDHLGAAAVDGLVYVVGGDVDGHAVNTDALDVFDPATGAWMSGAPLPAPRGSIAVTAHDGHVVALGGQNATETHRTVEAYDPVNATWETWPSMSIGRHGFGAASWDGRLYAMAGGPEPGLSVTGSVEVLGPVTS